MTQPTDIPYELLVDLAEDRLSPAERDRALARVAADPQAAAELAALRGMVDLMRDDTSEDAPDHVINRALRLFDRPAPAASPGLVQRLVAALRFDSAQGLPAFGLRSSEPGIRQLLFSAEGYDIDLRVTLHTGGWVVSGQVLGSDQRGSVMLSTADRVFTATLNDLSEFSFEPVPSGRYALTLRQDDLEVVVEDLEIGTV
jgi:hypothetical protein